MENFYKKAFLNSENKVINIVVFNTETPEVELLESIKDLHGAEIYLSVDDSVLIGSDYIDGRFTDVKPYDSWILNTETYKWVAPIPSPEPQELYKWDEETGSWIDRFNLN
jgi:hypothetical protein